MAGASGGPTLTVTQVRSTIGAKPRTRATLRALGLRGIGQRNVPRCLGFVPIDDRTWVTRSFAIIGPRSDQGPVRAGSRDRR